MLVNAAFTSRQLFLLPWTFSKKKSGPMGTYKVLKFVYSVFLIVSLCLIPNIIHAKSTQQITTNDRVMLGLLIVENMILCEQYYMLAMNAHRRDRRLENQMGSLIEGLDLMANYAEKGYQSIGKTHAELGKRRTAIGDGLLKEMDRNTSNIGKLVDRYAKQCHRIKAWIQSK